MKQCFLPIETGLESQLLAAGEREKLRTEREREKRQFVVLVQSSVRDLHAYVAAGSVDVILTDPPYPREYLHTWGDLAAFAVHALRPGGHLLAMSGQTWLPQVFDALCVKGLDYRWVLALKLRQRYDAMFRNVHTNWWKPILWYVRSGKTDKRITLTDFHIGSGRDKSLHAWGQSVGEFREILQRVSAKGDVVCDPFLGGGTSAEAALVRGCSFIGADIEAQWVRATHDRIFTEFTMNPVDIHVRS